MKIGDKIVFGKEYCQQTGLLHLLNKTIMLTPQYFEEDNGLYTYQVESPGIPAQEADDEPESIYHLFGDDLADVHDCQIIPAKEEDLLAIQYAQEAEQRSIDEYYADMGKYFSSLEP